MSDTAIQFRSRQGATMFAFHATTDPYPVLVEMAWAYVDGQSLCGTACPADDGGYCLDCHAIGAIARDEAMKREAGG